MSLPSASMCRELFALHVPNPERVEADFAVLAELSRGLSGGDKLNICLNSTRAGSVYQNTERRVVMKATIEAEIMKARKANAEHDVKSRKEQNGF